MKGSILKSTHIELQCCWFSGRISCNPWEISNAKKHQQKLLQASTPHQCDWFLPSLLLIISHFFIAKDLNSPVTSNLSFRYKFKSFSLSLPSCLIFVQTALFSFHHDKNAPTTTMSAISPPLHRFQRWKHRLPSTLISAHRPLRPHHLSSHQVRAITRRLRNRLRSNPRVRWDGTAAAVNLTAAPASHTSPHSSTVLKLQLMPLERKKWWVQQSAIDMLCLFDEC